MSDKTGQWELEGRSLYALNANGYNRFLARVEPGQNDAGKRISDSEAEGIARLMSAATDLLAALKACEAQLSDIGDCDLACAIDARAAIAKAVPRA